MGVSQVCVRARNAAASAAKANTDGTQEMSFNMTSKQIGLASLLPMDITQPHAQELSFQQSILKIRRRNVSGAVHIAQYLTSDSPLPPKHKVDNRYHDSRDGFF